MAEAPVLGGTLGGGPRARTLPGLADGIAADLVCGGGVLVVIESAITVQAVAEAVTGATGVGSEGAANEKEPKESAASRSWAAFSSPYSFKGVQKGVSGRRKHRRIRKKEEGFLLV